MALRILHTSDLHIGMTFRHYPDDLRLRLIEARFAALERLVQLAVDRQCHLMVIAGDLFEKQTVAKRDIQRVKQILARFSTGTVCILPGNHDYINPSAELWEVFCQDLPDNLLVLKEEMPVSLMEGEEHITLYPAPCHAKHSDTHNLGWLENLTIDREDPLYRNGYHIGVAHGALAGISPDLVSQYYTMFPETLKKLPQDLWLLGHAHQPYPAETSPRGARIYNAGTPEPDGMDCRHPGSVWFIRMHESDDVEAELLPTGRFRFLDQRERISDEKDIQRLQRQYMEELSEQERAHTLLRLKLTGYMDDATSRSCSAFVQEMTRSLAYFSMDDRELKTRFSPDRIREEFTEGSLPAVLLQELVAQGDEEAAHLAYEIIREVKDHAD